MLYLILEFNVSKTKNVPIDMKFDRDNVIDAKRVDIQTLFGNQLPWHVNTEMVAKRGSALLKCNCSAVIVSGFSNLLLIHLTS